MSFNKFESRFATFITFSVTVLILTACGGGGAGGGRTNSPDIVAIEYPDCTLGAGGTDDLAGCWISKECYGGIPNPAPGLLEYEAVGTARVRYLAEITQSETSPAITGEIKDYFILYEYGNTACDTPIAIIDVAEYLSTEGQAQAGFPISNITFYEIVGNELCPSLDASNGYIEISCVAIDVTVNYSEGSMAADPVLTLSSYVIADNQSLCVPLGDYDPLFELSDNAGVLFNSGWSAYRLNNILVESASNNCDLDRFIPST